MNTIFWDFWDLAKLTGNGLLVTNTTPHDVLKSLLPKGLGKQRGWYSISESAWYLA
jgi:hypothetical protein